MRDNREKILRITRTGVLLALTLRGAIKKGRKAAERSAAFSPRNQNILQRVVYCRTVGIYFPKAAIQRSLDLSMTASL